MNAPSAEAPPTPATKTGRTEAFSDGVFAIAITLLAFGLRVPPAASVGDAAGLVSSLLAGWPRYLAFTLSFFFILVMWVNHHRLMSMIGRVDRVFMVWNGLILLCVSLVPFGTDLMAEYLARAEGSVATAVYCGLLFITSLVFQGFWSYAARGRRLLAGDVADAHVEAINQQYRFGPFLYLGALFLAFVSVPLTVMLVLGMALFFLLPFGTREM